MRVRFVALAGSIAALSPAFAGNLTAAPLDRRIGWIDGGCLAITNASIPAGDLLTVVVLADPQSRTTAVVDGPAMDSVACPPLSEGRREANEAAGLSFYRVRLPHDLQGAAAIAIAGAVSTVADGGPLSIDVDGDGKAESFSGCLTAEGYQFAVRSGAPDSALELWSGYEFLGYDSEPTCF